MKASLLSIFILSFFLANVSYAQKSIKERDLKGSWKLVIELDESEGEGMLERAVLGAVDGIISGVDVTFQFKRKNDLKVIVNVFGEEEVEYTRWQINRDGSLYIGDNEHLDMDDTVWYLEGDRLVAYDEDDMDSIHSVYLERIY